MGISYAAMTTILNSGIGTTVLQNVVRNDALAEDLLFRVLLGY